MKRSSFRGHAYLQRCWARKAPIQQISGFPQHSSAIPSCLIDTKPFLDSSDQALRLDLGPMFKICALQYQIHLEGRSVLQLSMLECLLIIRSWDEFTFKYVWLLPANFPAACNSAKFDLYVTERNYRFECSSAHPSFHLILLPISALYTLVTFVDRV